MAPFQVLGYIIINIINVYIINDDITLLILLSGGPTMQLAWVNIRHHSVAQCLRHVGEASLAFVQVSRTPHRSSSRTATGSGEGGAAGGRGMHARLGGDGRGTPAQSRTQPLILHVTAQ